MLFRRKQRKPSRSRLEIEEGGLPPGLEEAISREGTPGNSVPGFTWPTFPVPPPFEAFPAEGDGATEEGLPAEGDGATNEAPSELEARRPYRQVVVVGADPAGLTLAIALAQQNIAVTVLDARRSLASSSRCATWSAHTLELWARSGVVTSALAAAVPRRRVEVSVAEGNDFAASSAVHRMAVAEVDGRPERLVAPCAVHLQQYRVEQLLHDALLALPEAKHGLVEVRWQSLVEDIQINAEGVEMKVSIPDDKGKKRIVHDVTAGYVVVCSPGLKTVVRDLAATPPRCTTPAATRTVLSVDMELPAAVPPGPKDARQQPEAQRPDDCERRLVLITSSECEAEGSAPGAPPLPPSSGRVAWLAVSRHEHPGGLVRLDALLPAGVDLAKAAKQEGARELARAVLGPAAGGAATMHSCIAQQFRIGPMCAASKRGRLFLCGEALAVLSPFGGAAGNMGVEDASNLAWKLALVILQGAPAALLETYQLERDAAHAALMRRQLHAEQVLAPSTPAHREAQRAALALLRAGHPLGAALVGGGSAVAPPTRLTASPLVLHDAVAGGPLGGDDSRGAPWRREAAGPGDVFADCAVEDLEHEVSECEDNRPATAGLGRGYLLGHLGPFFTLIVFAMSVPEIPWEALKMLDRSKLQLTLDLVRKVVIVLDASGLERMSEAHIEAVRRAQRIGTRLLADRRGSAAGAYDARPGSALLLRPDLHVAARWRGLRPREMHDAFLRATGHLLHEEQPVHYAAGRGRSPMRGAGAEGAGHLLAAMPRLRPSLELPPGAAGAEGELLGELALQLARAPAERRLAAAAAAVLLLANEVGHLEAAQQAIAFAVQATALGHPGVAAASPRGGPMLLTGELAQLVEAGDDDVELLADLAAHDRPENPVAATGAHADLVSPDAAAEGIIRLLRSSPETAVAARPPAGGLTVLREHLAAQLSEAEGTKVEAGAVFVGEGRCVLLDLLLEALLAEPPAPRSPDAALAPTPSVISPRTPSPFHAGAAASRGASPAPSGEPPPQGAGVAGAAPAAGSEGGGSRPATSSVYGGRPRSASGPSRRREEGEVLVVGPCPEAWRRALAHRRVRCFLPPPGASQNFAVMAEDIARHVAASTRVVLLPLFSHVTGLALDAAELKRLCRFIDYEVARRRAAGHDEARRTFGLALVVDVTLRNLLLDQPAKGKASAPLWVLASCRHSVVFGDLFHEWCSAPGFSAQYVASSTALSQRLSSTLGPLLEGACSGSGASLVQAVAATLPREQQVLESLRRRREVLCEALLRGGMTIIGGRPRAGRFLLARLPEDIGEAEYCEALAKHKILAEPGAPLGAPGCVRLTFAERFDFLEDSAPVFPATLRELRNPVRPAAALALPIGDSAGSPLPVGPGSDTDEEGEGAAEAGDLEALPLSGGAVDADAAVSAPTDAEAAGDVVAAEGDASAEPEEPQEAEVVPDPDQEIDQHELAEAEKKGQVPHLAAQLRQGARGLACVAQLSGSITTELIAQAGFELVVIDHENGPGNFGVAAELVRSALGSGAHAMFRLPSADVTQIRRAIEVGAEGVILPRVTSRAEAQELVELVRLARLRARSENAVEWQLRSVEQAEEEEEEGAEEAGEEDSWAEPKAKKPSKRIVEATPPEEEERFLAPRPLVAVELDVSLAVLDLALELLDVEGLDMIMVDPERVVEGVVTEHGGSYSPTAAYLPAPRPGGESEAEAAAGGAASPLSSASPHGHGEADAAVTPAAPAAPPPGGRRGRGFNIALKAPPMLKARREAAGITATTPAPAVDALQRFWADFDALPARAAEKRKLVGCTAHARTAPFELLLAGHSVVVLAADMVLLREGAVRHASEMKLHKQPTPRQYVAPLESARSRLATGALVSQLRRSKKALAAFLHLGDPLAAEIVALAGFEAVVLDHEQGPGDLLNAVSLIHAAASAGAHALLRVPGREPAYLRRALQLGVEGLILPQTESRQQAEDFVAMARMCWPVSSSLRGAAGPVAAVLRPSGAPSAQHLRRRGEELLLKACQVESEVGLAAVKEIAHVEGIDMVFFAPVELAASCARGQEAGLMLALETAEAEVKKARKLLGGMLVPGRSVEQMFAVGYDLVCTTSDVIIIRSTAENIMLEAKPPATGPQAELVKWVASGRQGRLASDKETLVSWLKKTKQARALGVLARLDSPSAVELVARSGFEVVVLDHARGPGDLLGAVGLIHAASRAGAHAIIRVPALSHAHLRRALQIGVEGIILPHVESAEEAHTLVELCLYPSRNYRDDSHAAEARMRNQPFRRMDFSFAPPLVEFYGQRVAEFTRRQGESVLIAAQIDTVDGAAQARSIAKVPGIDMIFVDALRLSGFDVERVEEAARSAGKLLGGLLVPGCSAEDMFRAGYKLVCAASDQHLLSSGARACAHALRPADRDGADAGPSAAW